MSKFSEQLQSIRVFNNFELLKRFGTANDVAIEYHPDPGGRVSIGRSARTVVWSPRKNPHLPLPRGLATHPAKVFLGTRKGSFPAALQWAEETFKAEYDTSPFGGRVPKHVVEKARAAVKAQVF